MIRADFGLPLPDSTSSTPFGSGHLTILSFGTFTEPSSCCGQAAIDFLRWVSLNGQGDLVRAIGLCPAGPAGEEALSEAIDLAQSLCDNQANAIPRDIFDRAARDAMASAIQGMLNGQASPQDVMDAAQRAKERGRR